MKFLARKWDLLVFALIVSGFVYVASVRLGEVPVPETDEAYTLQVSYEMLNRGKLALPMLRYLGGNIENVWHSYTPLFFVLLSGFLKATGWGVLEGRAFNLIMAVLTLLMVYVIGRRLFDWRAGLTAVVMLVSDQTFLERSRLVRNDFAAVALAMLAFYIYYLAEERKKIWLVVCSGLAAGAGVMCHTNVLYMLGVIVVLMFLKRGWSVVKSRETFIFLGSALLVMSYEIVHIVIDWNNFLLQNRDDRLHFHVLSLAGIQRNLVEEPLRYLEWIEGGSRVAYIPLTLLHIFQVLAAMAVIYLVARFVFAFRSGKAGNDPRVMVIIATVVMAAFMTLVSGNKGIYYLAHLVPWFALCVGIMLFDLMIMIDRVKDTGWSRSKLVHSGLLVLVGLATLAYGRALYRQQVGYVRDVGKQDRVLFDELKAVLRDVVPDGLCPVAMKSPEMWLAFPEADGCFASIENRMKDNVDIDGDEYALILPNSGVHIRNVWKRQLDDKYPVIGKLTNTVYGNIDVYYTGRNPVHLVAPQTYHFFAKGRGHFSDDQLKAATPVWSLSDPREHRNGADVHGGMTFYSPPGLKGIMLHEVATLNLESDTIYQLSLAGEVRESTWELVVVDMVSGVWVLQKPIGEGFRSYHATFKTTGTDRVKIALRPLDSRTEGGINLRGATISRIASLWRQ